MLEMIRSFINYKYGWHGDYKSWQDAQKDSVGYDSDVILQKVRSSLLKVKNGEAIYERDSVLFSEIQYSWPLLTGLMYAAAKSQGSLHVLDFGGSLGSSYFQNKKFLDEFSDVSWSVVEQKHFVDIGRVDFQNDRLKFFYDIKSCAASEQPNILVISSVLQYIDKPYEILDELLSFGFEYVLFDRVVFNKKNKSIITVQKIKDKSYSSIPCWLFGEDDFVKKLKECCCIIETFSLPHEDNMQKYEKGFICKKL